MNITDLHPGVRVQWRTWTGTATATITTWSSQGITLLHNDGHTEHHPTGLVYDLAGLIRDLEVVN